MGKDREGKFHPSKGRPSGNGKEIEQPLHVSDPGALEKYVDIASKYTSGQTEEVDSSLLRHPNRNLRRDEDRNQDRRQNITNHQKRNRTALSERTDVEIEEISTLSKEAFQQLTQHHGASCVTIYFPTNESGAAVNVQTDVITFKNKLKEASVKLVKAGVRSDVIDDLLRPANALLNDSQRWMNLTKGLAVFISQDAVRYIRLPYAPVEECQVNSTFFLGQLIPLMAARDYFYMLLLSKKQVKLFRADAFGMYHVDIPELPNGVDDVVHFEEKGDQQLFRTGSSGAGGGANYHGMGAGAPDNKENMALYFTEIDRTLWQALLHKEKVPLLLAGVEYFAPIYRQVAQYRNIWSECLCGNHEYDDVPSLYAHARKIMEPYFQERQRKALSDYKNHSASSLTSSIVDDVVPAAHYGQIAQLFAQRGEHVWGSFDETEGTLIVHEQREEGDECLIDKAMVKTWEHGGEVFLVERSEMPASSPLAALMRY